MHQTIRTLVVAGAAILLSGCASAVLDGASHSELTRRDKFAVSAYEAYSASRYEESIALTNKSLEILTVNGTLTDGRNAHYKHEAIDYTMLAASYFELGEFRKAADNWRRAYVTNYEGAVNTQRRAEEAEASNAMTRTLIGAVVGVAAMSKARTPQQITDIQRQTTMAIGELSRVEAVSVDPSVRDAGIPTGSVVRVPVVAAYGVFDTILRLRSQKSRGFCTAVRITPTVFLTNAHCIHSGKAGDQPAQPYQLTLHHEYFITPKQFTVRSYVTHQGSGGTWDGVRANDWAILVTSTPDTNINFSPTLPERTPDSVLRGEKALMLAGYSGDLNRGNFPTLHYNCKVGGRQFRGIFSSSCETAKGSSGSPVYTKDRPYRIVGLNAASWVEKTDEFVAVAVRNESFYEPLRAVVRAECPSCSIEAPVD